MNSGEPMKMESLRAEFMRDMTQQLQTLFADAGFAPQQAENLSLHFALEFSEKWQSQLIYIPKNFSAKKAIEHAEIRAKFNGNNHAELAEEYDKHIRSIYKIVN